MAAEVLAIHGGSNPNEPVEEVVADLEHLLDMARSGDIRALAYATYSAAGVRATGWHGDAGTREPLALIIGLLNHRFFQACLEARAED